MTTIFREELVTNRNGRQFWIHADDAFYVQRIGGGGPFQKHNLVRLRDLTPNARTIIDVGANIGMNTIEYATWAKTVHSFEPTPQTHQMLQKNVVMALNQGSSAKGWYKTPDGLADSTLIADVFMYDTALSSEPGESSIVIHKNNAGHNHLDNIDIPDKRGRKRVRRVIPETATVKLVTLDSYNFEDVDAIKIDVEGHEFEVLKGGEQTILKYLPVLQLEMLPAMASRFNHTCQDIFDWFAERDYVPTLSCGKIVGPQWETYPRQIDRFFVHKSKLPQ